MIARKKGIELEKKRTTNKESEREEIKEIKQLRKEI